ncbi:MAG: hypothetical protein COB54_06520 [Alphaproteobacteria bacterium]|nr:MAG: hypothetical protein COB54_06520 [Alphaproteobacteria bacterium]
MGLLWLFLTAVLGIFVFKINKEQNALQTKVDALERALARYSPEANKKKSPQPKPYPEPEKPVAEDTTPPESVESHPPEPQPTVAKAPQKTKSATTLRNLEESLSSRWMVWVGGLAIALGGGFLVKYSIDAGLLSPLIRVSFGFTLGIVLTVGGEILRQKRTNFEVLKGDPDYLPSAISAAGLFSAFAAIYASYALYELLPALGAFIALALLSFVASGLAWYQGRFFAYLGLIGGIIVPALVTTGSPSAWGLFPYLVVIITASLWVSRQKAWTDVAATTLVLALMWVVIWIPTNWTMGDIIPVGSYLVLLGILNAALLSGASPDRFTDRSFKGMVKGSVITHISDGVMITIVLLMVSLVRLDHYSATGLILLTLGLLAQAYAVHRSPAADFGGMMALAGGLFLFATWHVPNLVEFNASLVPFDQLKTAWAPTAPPGLEKFLAAGLIFTGVTGFAIYLRLGALMRQNVWASLGAIVPVLMLIITYWRIEDWGTSLTFAFVAVILAAFFVLAVIRLRAANKPENLVPLAAYAAGATTAISLGIAMVLRDAWLSFALALQIAALGHIWRLTGVRGLRTLALLLASIVFIRLTLNGSIFDYGGGQPLPVINWLFYGYALTAGLFAYAAHLFRQDGGEEDRLMSALKAGAILLAVGFVTLELRVLFSSGNRLLSDPTELETALQTINWAAATCLLFWFEVKNNDALLGRLRRFMTLVTLFGLVIGGGVINNVFIYNPDVGTIPIFNLQLLQFLIPGLLYGLKAYIAHCANKPRSIDLYGLTAFLAIWLWISVEVYNGFHPHGINPAVTFDGELYGYSLVWLIYAIALLLAGLKYHYPTIRKAGLLVLGVVVVKVFAIDMSQLEGISRALSFMGLGGALLGLGYLYQRLNMAPETEKSA